MYEYIHMFGISQVYNREGYRFKSMIDGILFSNQL